MEGIPVPCVELCIRDHVNTMQLIVASLGPSSASIATKPIISTHFFTTITAQSSFFCEVQTLNSCKQYIQLHSYIQPTPTLLYIMSPIAARIASRAVARRPFSMMASLRAAGRAMEAHPFERLPTATKSAPADWGYQVKRVGSQAAL